MHNIDVCKKCIDKQPFCEKFSSINVNSNGEEFVVCPHSENCRLRLSSDSPDDDCPFLLEHMVSVGVSNERSN